ncbi:MAG: ABC transporter permease [Candidatus Schekmanbacteria bacterium]|nr:MAG: ABC transporter permease [Candidatus Schekmanbacteria bacterium]
MNEYAIERNSSKSIHYFELLIALAKKDLKVRYKSASLGFMWAILNPLLMMVVLSIIFSLVFKVKTEAPYSVFVLCGLIPWTFFNFSLSCATNSIVDNSNLIKKVYFPREIIPISVILANLFNFCLSLIILFIFLLIFKIEITIYYFLAPIAIIIQFFFVCGMCLLTSGLNVYFRDVRYIVEAGLLFLFYLTPVFYPVQMVPERFRDIFMLNPMAGIIVFYREIFLNAHLPSLYLVTTTTISSLLMFIVGFYVFKKCEPAFADLI